MLFFTFFFHVVIRAHPVDLLLALIVVFIAPLLIHSNFYSHYSSLCLIKSHSEVFPQRAETQLTLRMRARIQMCRSLAQSVFDHQTTKILLVQQTNNRTSSVEVITAQQHSELSLITTHPPIPGKHYSILSEPS